MNSAASALVDVAELSKTYPLPRSIEDLLAKRRPVIHAVREVDIQIRRGETLGLIGESGSGKSTLGRAMLRLVQPTSGAVRFDNVDLLALSAGELRRLRRRMGVVFQNPYSSVNRRHTVQAIVGEPLRIHGVGRRQEREARVRDALGLAGLTAGHGARLPSELSGGQLQRVAIARALVLRPEFVVADEPTASLDVSIRAQIINLFADLKAELGLAMLFISHDLATVSYLADRVAVMYLGRVVELAPTSRLESGAEHPYTKALIASMPLADPARRNGIPPRGQIPSAISPPSGCAYHPRCPLAMAVCRDERPRLEEKQDGHLVACHAVSRAAP